MLWLQSFWPKLCHSVDWIIINGRRVGLTSDSSQLYRKQSLSQLYIEHLTLSSPQRFPYGWENIWRLFLNCTNSTALSSSFYSSSEHQYPTIWESLCINVTYVMDGVRENIADNNWLHFTKKKTRKKVYFAKLRHYQENIT
jgi:hypothetical protein